MKSQKSAKNAHFNFSKHNVTSSVCFFRPNNSPKHKDSSSMIRNDAEKKEIFTFTGLKQEFFLLFYLRNDWNNYSMIRIVCHEFPIDLIIRLIIEALVFTCAQMNCTKHPLTLNWSSPKGFDLGNHLFLSTHFMEIQNFSFMLQISPCSHSNLSHQQKCCIISNDTPP